MPAELAELQELERILETGQPHLQAHVLGEVSAGGQRFPLYAATLGAPAAGAPAVGFFGGVHGLERIGTQVLLGFLAYLVERLPRDEELARLLTGLRLVFMPLVNPDGMLRGRRSNGAGVDLMRNAPLEARERAAFFVGGQRWSARLPWYRGAADGTMEAESRALCDLVRAELLSRPFSLSLDCHSGFGLRDRIWFPHAHTRSPFARIAEVHALTEAVDRAFPGHAYLFEPQSRRYLAHGDLWDYLLALPPAAQGVFLPLTLEMGSWRWIRKKPQQLLYRRGIFNPLPLDRLERVKRNHLPLLQFLCRAARDYRRWLPTGEERNRRERAALATWFGAA